MIRKTLVIFLTAIMSLLLFSCIEGNINTVRFYSFDELYKTVKVSDGQTIGEINSPEVEGYEFLYWRYGNQEYDILETPVTKNLDLHAYFKQNIVTGIHDFDIFSLNDTHGAILENGSEMGLAKIANLIKAKRQQNSENTFFIANGDMFQGQLISNSNKGALMVELLNEMELDAFVIGNHEFDWGLEEILKYFDNSENAVKANFPILGANVKRKSDDKIPEGIKPYTIINKGGLRVGIIGIINEGLESSIAGHRIKDYYFSSMTSAVRDVYNEIEDMVDIVVVANHGNDTNLNIFASEFEKVIGILNGHTHSRYTGYLTKSTYIQSGSSGEYVGNIKGSLELLDSGEIKLIDLSSENLNRSNEALLNTSDKESEVIIDKYYQDLKSEYNDVLITTGESMSVSQLASFISEVMAKQTGAVAGFHNSGGTRDSFRNNQSLTAADLFKVFPFDNKIITVSVTGSELKQYLNDNYMTHYLTPNTTINDNERYLIAVNDYIFFHEVYYGFQSYNNLGDYETKNDMYESFLEVINNLKNSGETKFYLYSPILFNLSKYNKILDNQLIFLI